MDISPEAPIGGWDIITAAQLRATVFPPLKWAVPKLVPEGFGLFTGPPKAGKSWAVLDFALAVAAGDNVLGKVATGTPKPVLYLALEDGRRRLRDRTDRLLGSRPVPANVHLVTRVDANPGLLPKIGEWLDQHGRACPLIILDTLGRVMPRSLPGESAYERDYRIGAQLKALTDPHPGSTLLVVHHTRKAGSDDWMDSTSGTNGLNGAADFTLNLSRARNEEAGMLRVTGRDVPEAEYAVTYSAGRWQLDGTGLTEASNKATVARTTEGLGNRSAEVVAIVAQHPKGIGPTDLAELLGIEPKHAGEYLTRLFKAGRVRKPSRGLYTPVESVESVETEPPEQGDSTVSTVSTPHVQPDCSCGKPLDTPTTRSHGACNRCWIANGKKLA